MSAEYLKAWVFANKKRNEKEMGFFKDEKAVEYVEKLLEQMEGLVKTGLVKKTIDGNYQLAELADMQVEMREYKDMIADLESQAGVFMNEMRGELVKLETYIELKSDRYKLWQKLHLDKYPRNY